MCLSVQELEAPDVTGKKAAEELFKNIEHGGCVDEYLQDQVSQSEQHPLLLVQMMSALETFK